jgi:transcriptional regulator with XRE-family HTH domain
LSSTSTIFFQFFRNSFSVTQEELAKQLSLAKNSISLYESGKSLPTFKVLKNMVGFYGVTFDFFLQKDSCQYPRNLRLLNFAQQLDNRKYSESRNIIEASARSLLGEKFNTDLSVLQDNVEIELCDDFHKNLKELRNFRKMTQPELGEKSGASRTLIAQYELSSYPLYERLIRLAEILGVSIHALATGQKLTFDFQDRIFSQTMLLADHLLSLEQHKILITLMEAALSKRA